MKKLNSKNYLILLAILSSASCGKHENLEGSSLDPSGVTDGGSGGTDGGSYVLEEEGDKFDDVGTNPFTKTSHDPLSTFAADVDTASYDIFVRDIQSEKLPDPKSVRLEEYVNYFNYAYEPPAQNAEHPFALHLKATPNPMGDTTLLRVGIQAEMPPPEEKRPTNLVFLVDISGSMTSETKLPLVKQVLRDTLELLDPTDTISIVTYAGSTGVALVPTPISERSQIEAVIDSFSAGGSTAGAAGITLAYSQAESAFLDGGTNHILLCTDGDFNVGPSSTDELVELVEEKRATGITLTVLGFGSGNLNDAMMELISNKGNGIYGVISSQETASRYVKERMLSSFHLIAKDVKLQIEFNPEHVVAYRLLGYENRAIDDNQFREDSIDAGEIGAGHQVTGLYELVLEGKTIPTSPNAPEVLDGDPYVGEREIAASDMVLAKIRYKDPNAGVDDPATEVRSQLLFEDVDTASDPEDKDLVWAIAMAAFAEILKESPYANREALEAIVAMVDSSKGSDANRMAFADYLAIAKNLLDKE